MDMTTYNISIEKTSNEHIIKFATDTFLTEAESYEFSNADEAAISPLASICFAKLYCSGKTSYYRLG